MTAACRLGDAAAEGGAPLNRTARWIRETLPGVSAMTAAASIALAGCILFTGTFLAQALKDKGGEMVVAQVFRQQGVSVRGAQNKLLRGKTVSLLEQYVFAFADAAINFDSVPKLDGKVFLSLATAMPEEVKPTGMAYDHHDIILTCEAETAEAADLFYQRLLEESAFSSVSRNDLEQREDGSCLFEVICIPQVSEGQLGLELIE